MPDKMMKTKEEHNGDDDDGQTQVDMFADESDGDGDKSQADESDSSVAEVVTSGGQSETLKFKKPVGETTSEGTVECVFPNIFV